MIGFYKNSIMLLKEDLIKFEKLFENFKENKTIDEIEEFKKACTLFLMYSIIKNYSRNNFIFISVNNLFKLFVNLDNDFEHVAETAEGEAFDILIEITDSNIVTSYKLDELSNYFLFELLTKIQMKNPIKILNLK